ncbi:MAG: N-acetylneuraminate synthase [Planctomycetes bacterium]|nr:N-acetylneuraminate synthase [Planctomycetota bacterium]
MNRTFIIAEAGVNHNGSLQTAKKLLDVAVDAGADAVKFQTFKADKVVTATASKAKYQIENTGTDETQFEMLKRLELSIDAHKELFSYCNKKNIIFMSTSFDEGSADMLDNLGMTIFKIPSGEITNKPLIQHVAGKKKPIILSTGMSYLGEVEKAINWISEIRDKLDKKPELTLLHCVSNYPAEVEDSNLLAIKTMERAFGLPVGYSDHTLGIEIPIAAVALGARVIEKHFTLDRNMEGPDHKASLEPDELKTMVKAIRNVENALGSGIKKPTRSEEEIKNIARRSLVASRHIKAGETVRLNDISIKRPGIGIAPELIEQIINKVAKIDIKKDSLLEWDYFNKSV